MAQRKIGAAWARESEKTGKYLTGVIELLGEDIPVVIFKNSKKEEDKHPDYIIYRSEPKPEAPLRPVVEEAPLPDF